MKRKNLGKKIATLATVSALTVSCLPINVFAYGGEVTDVSGETTKFVNSTESSEAYQTWRTNVWDKYANADSAKIALTPGETEADLNFAWYSKSQGTPAVKVWKDGDTSTAKIVKGTAIAITASNVQGSTYSATNHVSVEGYFEENTKYKYEYTDNYDGANTVWSEANSYNTTDFENYSVILTGDPQIGASGTTNEGTVDDDNIARDTYNWNLTMEAAMELYPDAAFLLSAGDQVDKGYSGKEANKAIRESEYAGYLYPSVFRSLPVATTIGNHDTDYADYTYHFNNPNSEDELGATEAGSDYYFSYGDVLYISLNSNNRNQAEHRELMTQAVESNPDAKWRIVIFHSDIYGSGQPHADTDATANRIVLAPLMDEFDIDVCLTGHDHTYSRSYQILDGNVIDYDISNGSVTNPEGTLYVSTGSGSGSKYYELLNYTPYYIADRTNVCLPAFSALEFEGDSLTIKTYDYNGDQYAESFTINKTDSEISAEDVIAKGEVQLASTDKEYTEESLASLKTAVDALKAMQEAYTTAEDPMVAELSENFRTENDRCQPAKYGQIANAEDKDTTNGSAVHRFKKSISTLLDKTIYTQIEDGVELEKVNAPIVDAEDLEAAKSAVLTAIANLKVVEKESPSNEEESSSSELESSSNEQESSSVADSKNDNATDVTTTPTETGDSSNVVVCVAAMLIAAGTGLMMFRKKEEDCETR